MANAGYNKITLIGNLTEDPVERKYGNQGNTLAGFRLAVNTGKDKTALFVKGTAFSGLGKTMTDWLKKGSSVLVEARLQVQEYTDKSGAKRRAPQIVANSIVMLGEGSNAGFNLGIFVGNLTQDPQTRTAGGKAITRLRLAINDPRRKEAKADFIDAVLWENDAENAAKYLKRGNRVIVAGKLTSTTYTKKDETKGDSVEIVVQRGFWQKLTSKKQAEAAAQSFGQPANAPIGDLEDTEIPF